MTEPKDKKDILMDPFEIEESDLPPLDHDETDSSDPEEIASFLKIIDDEDESPGQTGWERDLELDPLNIAADLIDDSQDQSFVEEDEERPKIDAQIVNEEETSWSEGDDVRVDDLGDDWFVEDERNQSNNLDNGEEGPVNENVGSFGIDEDTWDVLEDDEPEDETEQPFEAMERLGIELPFGDEGDDADCSLVLDRQFLGPENGGVTAVVFQGGSPLAAGEGLFILGADGMLHAAWSENTPPVNANSIFVRGESIFLGTAATGALVTHDRGQHFRQLNSWFTQGLLRGVQASSEQVSTSFRIFGQVASFGYRLLGLTGRGQLFSSVDAGKTWRNLAIPEQCLTLSAIPGTSEIYMVTLSKEDEVNLWWSKNTDKWEPRRLPDFWPKKFHSLPSISLKASSKTLIIGSDDPMGQVAFTLDGCRTWNRVEGALAATAVALDHDDPMCMAASTYDSEADVGAVIYCEDRGQNWQTVLTIEPSQGDAPKNSGENHCSVIDLAVHTGRTREIVAVTKKGVYLISLTRKGVSH